MDEYIYV